MQEVKISIPLASIYQIIIMRRQLKMYLNIKIMKTLIHLFMFLIGTACFSQVKEHQPGVILKDVHYAPVSDVVVLEQRDEVYSADTSGKIIVHDQQSGKYLSTFKEADNYPIAQLLKLNDKQLTVIKKFSITPNQPVDSVYSYDLDTKKIVSRFAFKGTLNGKSNENYIAAVVDADSQNGMVLFQKDPFIQLDPIKTSKTVRDISFAPKDSIYAFTQNIGFDYKNELVVQRFNGEVLHKEELKESGTTYRVLFESQESFLLFQYDQNLKSLSIFRYQIDGFVKNTVLETSFFTTDLRLELSADGDQWVVFSDTNTLETPLVYGRRIKDYYTLSELKIEKPLSYLYIAKPNLIRGFITSDPGRDEPHTSIEFNTLTNQSLATGRSLAYGDNRAFFLSNGDYILQEYLSNFETNIRYYKASTFQNKYKRLKFGDWLKLNQGIDLYDRYFDKGQQEFHHNSIAFLGEYKDQLRLIDYNLDKDTFSYLSPVLNKRKSIVDYSSIKKLAIVVDQPFSITEYPSLRTLEVCTEKRCVPMEGLFQKAALSENGELLATIDQNFLFEIRSVQSMQSIYKEQLIEKHQYKLLSVDTTSFALAVQPPFRFDQCVKYTVFYDVDEHQDVKSQRNECFEIDAFTFQNSKLAIAVDNLGIFIDDRLIPIDQANPTVELSFNKDASLCFVSHAKGNIDIYDTTNYVRKAQWILENDERQMLVSDSGYYFANFEASDLLTLDQEANGKISDYLKPDEVLKVLGEIDQEYLAAIGKAEELRARAIATQQASVDVDINAIQLNGSASLTTTKLENTISFDFNGTPEELIFKHNGVKLNSEQWHVAGEQINLDFEVVDTLNYIEILDQKTNNRILRATINYEGPTLEPTLHVLAVGVSQYRQANNNLTFADKDALDIARFYGDIPKEDIQAYYDKFYAEPLSIHNVNGDLQMEVINRFRESRPYLEYLGAGGRYWYTYDAIEERFLLYDFKNAKVSTMHLPPKEKIAPLFSGKDNFIRTVDGDAFYFLSNGKWNRYDLINNSFKPIDFSFDVDLQYNSTNLYPLSDERWLFYEPNYDGLKTNVTITIYDGKNKQTINSAIENDQGLTLLKVSSDGSHFLYKDFFEGLYLYRLENKSFSLISASKEISTATLDKYYINVKEGTISRSNDSYEKDQRRLIWEKYDFDFQLLKQKRLLIDMNNVLDAVVDAGELFELRQRKSLANKDQVLLLNKEDVYAKAGKPASFKKTRVTYLLNEQATKKAIKQALQSLKSKVGPQDQVIVFFAGHGVLDQELNYYYAPHDMDFNKVKDYGVSFDAIIASLGETQSTKMLLLMDTCHSGNTLDMDAYEITQTKGKDGERGRIAKKIGKTKNPIKVSDVVTTLFDNLNTVNGVTVLAASSGQDVAFEARDLSNGAFTTAYLQEVKSRSNNSMQLQAEDVPAVSLSPKFISDLRVKILELTHNKQEMDIRERNELTTIRLW
ncbi:MAG: hypothetical protein CMF32_00855 [Leeuwenhoekiella sp.]|nr:hypothetical protein [Leeuwenhoekiella sp.]